MSEPIHDEPCLSGCHPLYFGKLDYAERHHAEGCPNAKYPCEKCGKPRHIALNGTPFTVCDECWDGPEEIRTMVMSWRVEHYRVKGLEVFPAFESHIYDPVVMLQCAHCLKAYGAETISTIPRHRESLEAEIEALKAERDEWRDKAGLHQIASAAHANRAAHLAQACRDLNKGIMRLRKGRDNAIKRANEKNSADWAKGYVESTRNEALRAEVARLEGLIALAWCCEGDNCARYCPDAAMHAEARAIKARQVA